MNNNLQDILTSPLKPEDIAREEIPSAGKFRGIYGNTKYFHNLKWIQRKQSSKPICQTDRLYILFST